MGENHFTAAPTALYGVVLLMAAVAYSVLQHAIIIAEQGQGSVLKAAIGSDWKGKLSLAAYATAIPASFWSPAIGWVVYVAGCAPVAGAGPAHRARAGESGCAVSG